MADLIAPLTAKYVPQRGLSLADVATYSGFSEREFMILVRDGRMPLPVRILGREIWDRKQVDTCMFGIFGREPRRTNGGT
jgi:hypothetical protein